MPAVTAKLRVARASALAAVFLLALKLTVALQTHSLGLLAEAAHSGLDLLATLFTWASIRIAARPADANHPFGHEKFETFAAFIETCLLVLTAVIIGWSALQRWNASPRLHVNALAFVVMLVSMAVDWRRSAMLRAAARKWESDALAADALNFSTDLATAVAVLVGLGCAAIGAHWHRPGLLRGDAIAAVVVAAAMLGLALRLGRRAVGVLLDEAPPGLEAELRDRLGLPAGVNRIAKLRLRRAGSRYFADLRLDLEPTVTLQGAQAVRDEVVRRIHARLPSADIVVEAQPDTATTPLERLQAVARRHNLNIHDLSAFQAGDGLGVEFHLELPADAPLARAHAQVTALESEMRAAVPALRSIVTHIEPESTAIAPAAPVPDAARLRPTIERIAAEVPGILDCHDVFMRAGGGHLALSCHCTFPDDMPVARVHELSTNLEAAIKRALPELFRVTIHPEPGSDNRQ